MYLAIKAPSRSLKTLFSAQTQHKVTWQVTQHSLTEIRKPELSTTTNHKEPVRTQNQNKETWKNSSDQVAFGLSFTPDRVVVGASFLDQSQIIYRNEAVNESRNT